METKQYEQALSALKSGFPVDDEYGKGHFALSDVNQKIIETALKAAIRDQEAQEKRNHDLTGKFKWHIQEWIAGFHQERDWGNKQAGIVAGLMGCTGAYQVELRGDGPDQEYYVAVDVRNGGGLLPLFSLNALGKEMAKWAGENLDINCKDVPDSREVQVMVWGEEEFVTVTLQMYLSKKR